MNSNNFLKRKTHLFILLLLFGKTLGAAPSVHNSVLMIFDHEYDWGSHIGQVKLKNGQLDSFSPQNEGQIIAIGSYEQKGKKLFVTYTVVSIYGVHECQDISTKARRNICLQAAEKYLPSSKRTCTYMNSDTHPFYKAYFKCADGSIFASAKDKVARGSIKVYQGISIKRNYYVSKIKGRTCPAFVQIGQSPVRLDSFSNGIIDEGVEFAVLGMPTPNLEHTMTTNDEYYLVFLHTEPLHLSPVCIYKTCVDEPQ